MFDSQLQLAKAGNVAQKVPRELVVQRPIWYKDGDDTTWVGFRNDKSTPSADLNDTEIAERYNWVNYSRLSHGKEKLVATVSGEAAPQTEAEISTCEVRNNGDVVFNDETVATGRFDVTIEYFCNKLTENICKVS
jgi:hypothetical protein